MSLIQILEQTPQRLRDIRSSLRQSQEDFEADFKQYSGHLAPLKRWLQAHKGPPIAHTPPSHDTSPTTYWEQFQQLEEARQGIFKHQKKMLMVGLSGPGLERNDQFYQWMTEWHLDTPVFQRLYRYVFSTVLVSGSLWRWHTLLEKAADELLQYDNYRESDKLNRQRAVVTTYIENGRLNEAALDEALRQMVEETATEDDQDNFKAAYLQRLSRHFELHMTDQHPLFLRQGAQLFKILVTRYVTQERGTSVPLLRLLNSFCLWKTPQGLTCFCELMTALKGTSEIQPLEKTVLQNWLLETVGDPRIAVGEWDLLKDRHESLYNDLLFWFNEQDFNFFFDFVFRDGIDEHDRKQVWQGYLKYATNFRAILPKKECEEFELDYQQKFQKKPAICPIENLDYLHAFVMKIGHILIYEVKETRNACYIYDLKYLEKQLEGLPSSRKRMVECVLKFTQNCFGNSKKALSPRDLLKHEDLAPNGSEEYSFKGTTIRHWRFIHDYQLKWHGQVKDMMREVHRISWTAPQKGGV